MTVRPGPLSIAPGAIPGGVVVHVYEVPTGRLLHVTHAAVDANVAQLADHDADVVGQRIAPDAAGVCLVSYDGDTGERFKPGDWR